MAASRKKIGIWMDHSIAHLMEYSKNSFEIKTIESNFTQQQKLNSFKKGEAHMHKKELYEQSKYYKKLIDVVKKYKNTYRMGEIKNEIIKKKYKIQGINNELASIEKDKINNYELQINSLKKYVSELEDENLNDVIRENYGKKLILVTASLHMREHEDKLEIIKNLPSKDKISIIDEADFGAHKNNSQDKIDFIN